MKIALAALLLTSSARAAGVVYDHPALKMRLTAFTVDGAKNPDAVAYEGRKGFYLIKASELRTFERVDGWSGIVQDVREFTPTEYIRRDQPYVAASSCRYADDACVAVIEGLVDELRARGKREAPDDFALRTAELSEQAASEQSTWRSYEAEAVSDPDAIADKAALDAGRKPLDEAAAAVARARALRIGGECRAAAAAPTTEDPNPRAEFYWRQSLALDAAADTLTRADWMLRSQPVPAY